MDASEELNKNKYTSPLEGVTIESIQITLDLYRSGQAGVPVDTLWKFACPILNHYQLELSVDPSTDVLPENADDIILLLDVLETASMVWDYCALEPAEKMESLNTLTSNLLGPSPEVQEAEQFMQLLGAMESLWQSLSTTASASGSTQFPCGDTTWPSSPLMSNGSAVYGPEKLDMPEAFALFSRPLLENELVNSDPDLLDDAMMRAQFYWDLAHTPHEQFDRQFSVLYREMGSSSLSESSIRQEAITMVKHFHTLFPERV